MPNGSDTERKVDVYRERSHDDSTVVNRKG